MSELVDINDRRDQRLIGEMLRCGGQLKESLRNKLIIRLNKLFDDPDSSAREIQRLYRLLQYDEQSFLRAREKLLDKRAADKHEHIVQGHVEGPPTVRIIEADDYYGSTAAAESAGNRLSVAAPDEAPTTDPAEPGEDQAADVREAVREVGGGEDRSDTGARAAS